MNLKSFFATGSIGAALLLSALSCEKKLSPPSRTLSDAKSLSSGSTQIYVGYYRTYGNHFGSITTMPSVVNIVDIFGSFSYFGDSLPSMVTTLHGKGIRVEYTGSLALIAGAGSNAAGYHATAAAIMDTVNKYNLDGFDIDIEQFYSGQTLTDYAAVYDSLAHYLGPKSGTGKLLTYDTNLDGTNALFDSVYQDVSYVYFQDYGQGAGNLPYYWSTYSSYISSSQFIPGFSFYEEYGYQAGNIWYDVNYPLPATGDGTGHAYDIANWSPKGGEFGYAIDRDAPLLSDTDNRIYAPTYVVSNQLAAILNPSSSGGGSGGSGGIVSGATYKIVSATNNSSLLQVTGGSTAEGTTVELWSDNNPTSTYQEWVVTQLSNGYYTLQPVNASGEIMNVKGNNTTDGTQIIIWPNYGTSNEEWKIASAGNGYYTLSPANAPGMSLDDSGGETQNGNEIEIYSTNGSVAQEWQFVQQ